MSHYVLPATRLGRNRNRTDAVQTKPAQQPATTVRITQDVTVTRRSESRSHLLTDSEHWGWEQVRDYVVSQIEDRFGVFPRDHRKEAAIFKRFHEAYGDVAPVIAQYAFEVCDGWWKGAPIQITRFCKGSDPFFADPIIKALSED